MHQHRLVLLLMIVIYALSPTIMDWWIDVGSAWYRPYIAWFVIIAMTVILQGKYDADEL